MEKSSLIPLAELRTVDELWVFTKQMKRFVADRHKELEMYQDMATKEVHMKWNAALPGDTANYVVVQPWAVQYVVPRPMSVESKEQKKK